jgi:hypothetical protein
MHILACIFLLKENLNVLSLQFKPHYCSLITVSVCRLKGAFRGFCAGGTFYPSLIICFKKNLGVYVNVFLSIKVLLQQVLLPGLQVNLFFCHYNINVVVISSILYFTVNICLY